MTLVDPPASGGTTREVSEEEIGALVQRASHGDRGALDRSVDLLYAELRAAAEARRAQWLGEDTLSPTALINEVYLRLAVHAGATWHNRAQFMGVASRAMRQVLIDYSRRRRATKRGGELDRVTLDRVDEFVAGTAVPGLEPAEVLIRLEESLARLERESERHARIVECRFFGGMTVEETAQALDLSIATVNRGWKAARAWLRREVARPVDSDPPG